MIPYVEYTKTTNDEIAGHLQETRFRACVYYASSKSYMTQELHPLVCMLLSSVPKSPIKKECVKQIGTRLCPFEVSKSYLC